MQDRRRLWRILGWSGALALSLAVWAWGLWLVIQVIDGGAACRAEAAGHDAEAACDSR